MRAYVIRDEHSGEAVIEFAKDRATAQSNGANELSTEFSEVSCRRAAEFDSFAAKGQIPMQTMLDAGWWYYCSAHCGKMVDENHEGKIVLEDKLYCSQGCKDTAEKGTL